MECQITTRKNTSSGFTLAEVMVASGLALMVITTLVVVYAYYLRAFASLENYMNMSQDSQLALDKMTKEIRQANKVTYYSGNKITFDVPTYPGSSTSYLVSYSYDAASQTVIRATPSNSVVFLNGCTYWTNNIYDGKNSTPLSKPGNNCKVVQLTWICARAVLGHTNNTEDVQSAKIVIRKQRT